MTEETRDIAVTARVNAENLRAQLTAHATATTDQFREVNEKMDNGFSEIRDSIKQLSKEVASTVSVISARENQAKGAVWAFDAVRSLLVFAASFGGLKWLGFLK